jgi:hypothetical protein
VSNTVFNSYSTTPTVSVESGFYKDQIRVSLIGDYPENETLRYTINGNEPTNTSPIFVDTLTISETLVLKVKSFSEDTMVMPSFISFNTYFIDEEFTLPVFSVAANRIKNLANGQKELRPVGSVEYFDAEGNLQSKSYGELNSHGQDSWQLNQRSLDWISRDEMGYSADIDAKLFNYSDRANYQKIIFRASGDDNYPAINDNDHRGSTHVRDEFVHELALQGGMSLDVRAVERSIVFLNGEYWGVYATRERPNDHDFTDYYYGQDKYDLQYFQTWGETWTEYGDQQAFDDWAITRDLVLNNDMADSSNYAMVNEQLDVISLIDYLLMNLNTVASDWLNYNTGWWRGLNPSGSHKKWGYILWDNDATFDYYINYSGVPNTDPDAQPCDLEEIGEYMDQFFPQDTGFQVWWNDTFWQYPDPGKHEKIFFKLLEENHEFQDLYYGRFADLMNTVFSCDNMLNTLDSMIATIAPEMPRQIARWGGSMSEWMENVAKLRSFVEQRCTLLDDGLVDCYNVSGPYNITLMSEPEGFGFIDFNTISVKELPWSGDYFGNMQNSISAVPFSEQIEFSHWKTMSGEFIDFEDSLSSKTKITIFDQDTLVAVFKSVGTSLGQIVINEAMASNQSSVQDQDGDFDDWIEFYNGGDEALNISGYGLSDDISSIGKYKFPQGTIIEADGYLIVWADDDQEQDGLHTQFKLSAGGESLYLSNVANSIIDELTFGEQISDQSIARRPNGVGSFTIGNHTFNRNNDLVGTNELTSFESFKLFPNPSTNILNIEWKADDIDVINIDIYNALGERIEHLITTSNTKSINVSNYTSGIYLMVINNNESLKFTVIK